MRTFEFDKNGDWTLGMVSGADEIVQAVEHNLLVGLGEWFLNESVGFDVDVAMQKPPNERRVANEINRCLLYDDRVKEVLGLDLDFDYRQRVLHARFKINTEEGIVDGEIDRRFWI